MAKFQILVPTNGERFYSITEKVKDEVKKIDLTEGLLILQIMHTSCALTINEDFAPEAHEDMSLFLKHLAPRNLKFIKHDDEGPDDSPSHMKSILLNQTLSLPIESGEIQLGRWQGLFLAEFRDAPQKRTINGRVFWEKA